MTALLILCGVLIAVTIAVIAIVVAEDLKGRGEVAEAPEELPVWQGCRLNATPHWCFDAPLPSVPPGTGERLARELTDFLKGSA